MFRLLVLVSKPTKRYTPVFYLHVACCNNRIGCPGKKGKGKGTVYWLVLHGSLAFQKVNTERLFIGEEYFIYIFLAYVLK